MPDIPIFPSSSPGPIPEHLPVLGRGRHIPGSGEMCAMEAAAWLSGDKWTDRPGSVHPAIAAVARWVNDSVLDDERQTLWPLILDSIGTAGRYGLRLSLCLRWTMIRAQMHVRADPKAVWEKVLALYQDRTGRPGARRLSAPRTVG